MKRVRTKTVYTIVIAVVLCLLTSAVCADTWEFGTSADGKNPFTPRGYMINTGKSIQWLGSVYDNAGDTVKYSGKTNGVDYIEAEPEGGSSYTFYAITDRNPWPDNSDMLAYGKKYFFAYKNGKNISDFVNYFEAPPVRASALGGAVTSSDWAFKISGFKLEAGSRYEFGFLRGMQAKNGITLVFSRDEANEIIGYIQQLTSVSSKEKEQYNKEKNTEYEFVSSWAKKKKGGFAVNTVPMRFSLQTYADVTKWDKSAKTAQDFLDVVTENDLATGKYKRTNITQLQDLLKSQKHKVDEQIKYMIQQKADQNINTMVSELNAMLEKAKSEKPQPVDLTELKKKIKAAETLYDKVSTNVGTREGQYGQIEVEALKAEIQKAKALDKFSSQGEISREIQALDDAMTEVKASKVQKTMKIYYDKVTGIYVMVPVGTLPLNAELIIKQLGEETNEYALATLKISSEMNRINYYIIQFYSGDKKVEPAEGAKVQIPVSTDVRRSTCKVYEVGSGGNLTEINANTSVGIQSFETEKLGSFLQVGEDATEEEKEDNKKTQMVLKSKSDNTDDNKRTELQKKEVEKEKYKKPLNRLKEHMKNESEFSAEVRIDSNPFILIIIAICLAITAVLSGIRGLRRK